MDLWSEKILDKIFYIIIIVKCVSITNYFYIHGLGGIFKRRATCSEFLKERYSFTKAQELLLCKVDVIYLPDEMS